jgi:2-aminoethylphosphonate-pyruvate transaminase
MPFRPAVPNGSLAGTPTPAGRVVLMSPGPVNVDPRVRSALNGPDICHREHEFNQLLQAVKAKTTAVCGGSAAYTSIVITGSGTAAVEATVSSVVPADGGLLVLSNGHYGERLAAIARVHGLRHRVRDLGWAARIDVIDVDRLLAADPSLTHVGVVHHETSTGMLNPVHDLGTVVARHRRSFIVDAISSLGGETLDVRDAAITWCIGSSNKCLEGMPGLSFVCAQKTDLQRLAGLPARSFYLSLHRQYVAQDVVGVPAFTPAVQSFAAFGAALDLMLEEGVAGRTARYSALADQLRRGLAALGLEMLLPAADRSSSLTVIRLPDSISYHDLHSRLRAAGYVAYAAQERLASGYFRLANMGSLTPGDIDGLLGALGRALAAGPAASLENASDEERR